MLNYVNFFDTRGHYLHIYMYFCVQFPILFKLINQSEKECYYWNVNACSKRCIRKLL